MKNTSISYPTFSINSRMDKFLSHLLYFPYSYFDNLACVSTFLCTGYSRIQSDIT